MLLDRVDSYLRRTKMAATRFGRDAVGDPNFVLDLREGRAPRRQTAQRVIGFIEAQETAVADAECSQ